ncbi:Mechanosensitive ion channel-domain-containing protein [Phlebopus sp. FC_14]|nr:Mechanosensitive ion channel-domain-containing protein [Phlebopus sp. FC_14]
MDRLHRAPSLPPHSAPFAAGDELDDVQNPFVDSAPSPPYRPVASSSQIALGSLSQDSPAYRSHVELMSDYDKSNNLRESSRQNSQSSDQSESSGKQSAVPKPTVHYPDDVDRGPAPQYFNSPPRVDSHTSSIAGTDDEEEEEEEFDWSGDDDLVDEEAKFEKQMGVKLKSQRWSIWRLFTLLFSSLIGSIFLAGILVTPALLVHFFWYKPHPTTYRRYVDQNVEAWLFWAAANVVISWGLAMIVDIVPAVIRILISLSWGHVSEEIKSHIELYDSVKDTFKPVLYAASAWLSWIILFQNIFQLYNTSSDIQSYAAYTDRVAQTIEFLFFFALVICAQRMLSHAIAFAFHQTAYKERLEEVKTGLRIIEKLRAYKPRNRQHNHRTSGIHTPMFSALGGLMTPFSEKEQFNFLSGRSRPESPTHIGDDGNDGDAEDGSKNRKGKGKPKHKQERTLAEADDAINADRQNPGRPALAARTSSSFMPSSFEGHDIAHKYPPTPVHKRSADPHTHQHDEFNPAIQAARALKTAVLHDARNIKGANDDLSGLMFSVNSTREAKRLARAIYKAFRDRRRTHLVPADFYPAFPTQEDAHEAFRFFDRDNNEDISRAEIKATLLRIYRERRLLSRSMRDVGAALKSLNQILLFFALVILFFISLSVFGLNVTQSLTSVYSLGLAASFIFKNSASNAFDAIVFLFVTHPFDTGDRCFIDNDNLTVKKMGLFATVFTRADGTETYYFNSQLFTKFITNVRRSDKMVEGLTLQVAWRTPLEKLDALESRLNEWLGTEENRWFQPSTTIILQQIDFQRHLEITIIIPHNATWQDWGLYNMRRTVFHAAVQYYCRQLGIVAYESPLPIVYADPDTQQYTLPAEFDVVGDSSSSQKEISEAEATPKSFLGFTPPSQQDSQAMRVRKSRSRKVALRGIGADGGLA